MGVACLEFRGENFRGWLKNREIREFSPSKISRYTVLLCYYDCILYGISNLLLTVYTLVCLVLMEQTAEAWGVELREDWEEPVGWILDGRVSEERRDLRPMSGHCS